MAAPCRLAARWFLSSSNLPSTTRLFARPSTSSGQLFHPLNLLNHDLARISTLNSKRVQPFSIRKYQKDETTGNTLLQIKEDEFTRVLHENVNAELVSEDVGRVFAIVHIGGCQRKVTVEDMIYVEGTFFPNIGDRIKLEKVLLVGNKNFTVIGRPILKCQQTTVEATVIEKTLEVAKPVYKYKKRKNYHRFKLHRQPLTLLRINKIELHGL